MTKLKHGTSSVPDDLLIFSLSIRIKEHGIMNKIILKSVHS